MNYVIVQGPLFNLAVSTIRELFGYFTIRVLLELPGKMEPGGLHMIKCDLY